METASLPPATITVTGSPVAAETRSSDTQSHGIRSGQQPDGSNPPDSSANTGVDPDSDPNPNPDPDIDPDTDINALDAVNANANANTNSNASASLYWKWIALGSIALWLITMVYLITMKSRSRPDDDSGATNRDASEREWRNGIKSACLAHNPTGTRTALKGWGRAVFDRTLTLEQLVSKLDNNELGAEITALDQWLYAANDNSANWSGDPLWKLFANYKVPNLAAMKADGRLQPLYPVSGEVRA